MSVLLTEAAEDLFGRMGSGIVALDGEEAARPSLHDSIELPVSPEESSPAAEAALSPSAALVPAPANASRGRRPSRWIGLAALVIAGIFLVTILLKPGSGHVTLAGAIDAHWKDPRTTINPGAILPGSELELTSGLVQIHFPSGA